MVMSDIASRERASERFHHARRQASIETLLARLTGRSAALWSFEEVVDQLGIDGQFDAGLQEVPLEAIVGSVGRYDDFTRTFLPRKESDRDRWISVETADIGRLPPIDLYQIGDSYFVKDGNHRVSVARQEGLVTIDANVVVVRTRVDLPEEMEPDSFIIASGYRGFLDATGLDRTRAPLDMQVSIPGQYEVLLLQIASHGKLAGTQSGTPACESAAATWYDEIYLPLVAAIREQGILRYFPGRTETDFFVWLSQRRKELQDELGWEISPDVAVAHLATQAAPSIKSPSVRRRLARRLKRPSGVEKDSPRPPENWSAERLLDRYSNHLFGEILLPVSEVMLATRSPDHVPRALQFASSLARLEDANVNLLCILPTSGNESDDAQEAQAMTERLRALQSELINACNVAVDHGERVPVISKRAIVNDAIVIDRRLDLSPNPGEPGGRLNEIIQQAHCPIFVVGALPEGSFINRALLHYNGSAECEEALFVAAYMAEQWEVALDILLLAHERQLPEYRKHLEAYLMLHEVDATIINDSHEIADYGGRTVYEAALRESDLILLPGPPRNGHSAARGAHRNLLTSTLQRWPNSILVTT